MELKRIEEILGQELKVSPEVDARIEETYRRLRKRAMAAAEEKATGMGNSAGYKKRKHSRLWVILAAAMLLSAGVSVYAAVRYFTEADLLGYMAGEEFGIADFWKKRGIEASPESEVLQMSDLSGEKMENQYAVYNIQEAFYDGEVIYMVVEVTPKGEYLIVPQDYMEDDPVQWLLPDELPEEMNGLTLAEYAEANEKELLFTGVGISADSCSVDFLMTEGGSGYFCMTAPFSIEDSVSEEEQLLESGVADQEQLKGSEQLSSNVVDAEMLSNGKISVQITGTARLIEDKAVSRCEAEAAVLCESDAVCSSYIPDSQEELNNLGIILQKVEIKETDFGVYATIYYDLDLSLLPNDIANGMMMELAADRMKMQSLPYYSGGGTVETENGFLRTNAYQRKEGTKEYSVIARNYETGEVYGSVKVVKE